MSGDLDQADLELIRGANLVGDQIIIALGMQLQAMTRGDRAQIEKVISSLPPSEVIQHVMRSHLDEPQAALAELRRLAEDPAYPKNTISVTALVFWAAYFGDPELSLRLWRKFPPEASFAFMIWRPIVKDMRRLPGFKDLVRDLGLVDYWRASGNWNDFCRPLGKDDFDCT
jgi:hypothetical protein